MKRASEAVDIVASPMRKTAKIVGPCSSRRWKPELDTMEVGLSIRTLGSAEAVGTEGFCPIF